MSSELVEERTVTREVAHTLGEALFCHRGGEDQQVDVALRHYRLSLNTPRGQCGYKECVERRVPC